MSRTLGEIKRCAALWRLMLPRSPSWPSADCLDASLREYQLEGLRWLVSMWDNGTNCILAGGGWGWARVRLEWRSLVGAAAHS